MIILKNLLLALLGVSLEIVFFENPSTFDAVIKLQIGGFFLTDHRDRNSQPMPTLCSSTLIHRRINSVEFVLYGHTCTGAADDVIAHD